MINTSIFSSKANVCVADEKGVSTQMSQSGISLAYKPLPATVCRDDVVSTKLAAGGKLSNMGSNGPDPGIAACNSCAAILFKSQLLRLCSLPHETDLLHDSERLCCSRVPQGTLL